MTAANLPVLNLTDDDETVLRQLANKLTDELLAEYDTFVHRNNRHVDPVRWKPVRSDGDLHAFRERKSALRRDQETVTGGPILKRTHSSSSSSNTSSTNSRDSSEYSSHRRLAIDTLIPRHTVAGLHSGKLDDIMFGSSFRDLAEYQAFWSCQKDAMDSSAVLATLEGPTSDDPYRFLGITWFFRAYPLPSKLLHRRDALLLNDLHLRRLSNGERIGISIQHSIRHRDVVELRDFATVRINSSLLQLFRQHDANRVEVFSIHFLDTKGNVPESFHLQQSLGYVFPNSRYVNDHGFHKKLTWLMNNRVVRDSVVEPSSGGGSSQCELCTKSLTKIFSSSGTACLLCYKRICSRCNVSQTVPTRVSPKQITFRPGDFCIECIMQARAHPTLTIAQEEFLRSRTF